MSRWERRQYFEALCALRARYATLGADDMQGAFAIETVIADASAQLMEPKPGGTEPARDEQAA